MTKGNVLVTGGAGFIGSHVVDRLLAEGWDVTCLDSFHGYYDPAIKESNVAPHLRNPAYRLVRADLRDRDALAALPGGYDVVVHLAAQAGVRPSIADPLSYQEANVTGTQNLLEAARKWGTPQFVFASSSSVYGVNPNVPWREDDHVLQPISPYAATKVAGELLGHVYSHLHGMRFLALRFFTVYGPRQRPDLAIHKFARLMLRGEPIPVFGDGSMARDYTFVGDTVEGIRAGMDFTAAPFEIINLGNNHAVTVREMVRALEDALGVEAKVERHPEQPGDVPRTWADIGKAEKLLGYRPRTRFPDGVARFVGWMRGIEGPAVLPSGPSRTGFTEGAS